MTLSHFMAFLHIGTLPIGFSGLLLRSRALKNLNAQEKIADVLYADNMYGIAALLWIGTGFWRAFGGLEKGTDFYLHNMAFLIKMGFFALVFGLEIYPMITFTKWRIALKRGESIDISTAPTLRKLSRIQLVLLMAIVFMATAMARSIWY